MLFFREFFWLLKKEFTLEWRQRYAISGILLYVLSTIFIIYTSFIRITPNVWNVIFWIIALFAAVNTVAKSFVQESGHRQLYYYVLANPAAVILSKIIYNTLLLLLILLLSYGFFGLVAGNPVKNNFLFLNILLLASLGFSITFTFISAISGKAGNSATMMAILSFPVIIPMLMTLIKLSAVALRLLQDTSIRKDIAILISIDMILLTLSFILFPYLWRD